MSMVCKKCGIDKPEERYSSYITSAGNRSTRKTCKECREKQCDPEKRAASLKAGQRRRWEREKATAAERMRAYRAKRKEMGNPIRRNLDVAGPKWGGSKLYHLRKKVYEVRGKVCFYCGKDADQIDHIIPTSKGGSDRLDNVVPCCRSCNSSKQDKDVYDWYVKRK